VSVLSAIVEISIDFTVFRILLRWLVRRLLASLRDPNLAVHAALLGHQREDIDAKSAQGMRARGHHA